MRKIRTLHFKCYRCSTGHNLFVDSFLEPNNDIICKNCNAYFGFFKSEDIEPKESTTKQTLDYFKKLKNDSTINQNFKTWEAEREKRLG